MVTTLPTQWEQTHGRIGIERTNAIQAHLQVRAVLERDTRLQDWSVDTVLIGSYKRKTAIYPVHDVDVFVKLPGAPVAATPEQIFSEIQRVLVNHYGERATEQRRSMKVSGFAGGLTVDAVPAVPEGHVWKIPQTAAEPTGDSWVKDRWEETDPEHLTELTDNVQAASSEIAGQRSYLRTVRIIKQIRDTHIGADEKPGGLYFELLTYWAFGAGVSAPSYAELLAPVLSSISGQLASGSPLIEPGMGRPYDPAPSATSLARAAGLVARLAVDASRALGLDDCEAAVVWRRMLGENEKVGWCFPLPPGCSESGTRISPLVNRDRGSNTDRGFA